MKTSRLGRGLEALFQEHDIESVEAIEKIQEGEVISELKIEDLRPNPYQPRKSFDDEKLTELAASIKEHGILQPIIVKKDIKGYIIIAGERRFRASKQAKLEVIPAIVREYSDELMMQHALIENLQREDLNPIEEAKSYQLIMQKLNLTQEKFSAKIGKSRTYVANILRLLALPEFVRDGIENKEISMGHAKVLAGVKDKDLVYKLALLIQEKQISVRELENFLKEEKEKQVPKKKIKKEKPLNHHIDTIEKQLNIHFSTKVNLKDKGGKGQIIIDYLSEDDLDRILEILNFKID